MLPIPRDISAAFEIVLKKRRVPALQYADYQKWLRYYLDFQSEYHPPASRSEQVRLFIDKLKSKGQSPENQKQAANALTVLPETKEKRRNHVHEKNVQEALHQAVRRAKLTKRVTSQSFRHSFATHPLQANYDIRTIQTLLGHADVRTTMIYTHCVPSRTVKEAKSPLDF